MQLKRIITATGEKLFFQAVGKKDYIRLYNDYASLDIPDIKELVECFAVYDIKILSATPLSLFKSRAKELQMFSKNDK